MLPESTRSTLLIIDDQPANITALSGILKAEYRILFATSGREGLNLAWEQQPDLILLDVVMPEMDGHEVFRQLKDHDTTRETPLIFITSHQSREFEAAGLLMGAVDYITKPFHPEIVKLRVRNQMELKRHRENQQHMMEKLRQSEEMRRLIIDNTPCGIVATDEKGRIQVFNTAAENLFGYSKEEAFGRNALEMVPTNLQQLTCEIFRSFLKADNLSTLGLIPFEMEAVRHDGVVFPVRMAINPVKTADGTSYVGMIVDISGEKRLFEEVARLEKTIIESAPFGIIVADDELSIRMFNAAAEILFDYQREAIIGQSVISLLPLSLYETFEKGVAHYRALGELPFPEGLFFEVRAKRRNGQEFPARLAVNRMEIASHASFVAMVVDITEEKRLLSELVQSEKMAGLGGLVAGVAHEINTPVGNGVTAISELQDRLDAFIRLADEEGLSEEELKDHLASTQRLVRLARINLERATELMRSFKSVAVDQSSEQLRTFKLRAYVESAITTLHHRLKNTRISIMILCPQDLEIRSYPGAISQIVINLIENALLHAFPGDDYGLITLTFTRMGERLHFTYQDNGQGMTEEIRQRIFEPFFTTRRDHGGSGLGMHIVYNLVTSTFGGTISCQSSPNQGVTIQIDMPMHMR
ncbi:MAG: PAS domain S-box protein [Magnetococcales bacterium]|nr:PAS domain S-box protein [Magnetococcales bacterium]